MSDQEGADESYATKVFFGNLPWRTRWQDLKDWLKTNEFEATFTNIGRDRRTNRSKGFGLAEFETEEIAKKCIETLNGAEFEGRKIYVREDRPPENRPRKPRKEVEAEEEHEDDHEAVRRLGAQLAKECARVRQGEDGGQTDQGAKKKERPKVECENGRVFVGNLAWSVTWKQLVDHLAPCGDILYAEILTGVGNRSMGYHRRRKPGCALVTFKDAQQAQKAVDTLTDSSINDRKIYIREDRETSYCVFINRIPSKMTWQSLKDMCSKYGKVVRSDRNPKGYGTVRFETEEEADACIKGLNGSEYEGRELQAMFCHEAAQVQREAEEAEVSAQGSHEGCPPPARRGVPSPPPRRSAAPSPMRGRLSSPFGGRVHSPHMNGSFNANVPGYASVPAYASAAYQSCWSEE